MKKMISIATICVLFGVGAGWLAFHQPAGHGGRAVLYYRDPMNPENTSPTPRKAPDGMDYVPVYAPASEGADPGRRILYYKDPMHPWYTSDKPGKAPDCGMDLVPVYEGESDESGRVVKIDPATVQNIGVTTETVGRRTLTKTVRTMGKIGLDETKTYAVTSKVMGWVEKLYVDYTGQSVRKGDPLMDIYSPDLVSTQEEYLQALRYRSSLDGSGIAEARRGADELVESARRRLQNWDISDEEIASLAKRGTPQKAMKILAPVSGVVTDKMVLKGQNVMPGMTLYTIADLHTVWILADIYQYELPWVHPGDMADIELSYLPGRSFKGNVSFVYPFLSDDTKTARVRIEMANTPALDFKPDMFATVKITSPERLSAVTVPDVAIIRTGERNVVIVALGHGYYEPKDVRLGLSGDGYVQILSGLKEGEQVVTSAQFLIDSESNLKAALNTMQPPDTSGTSKPLSEETGVEKPSAAHLVNPDLRGTGSSTLAAVALASSQKQLYTCVMHPEVLETEPGDCPKCGMKLTLKKG